MDWPQGTKCVWLALVIDERAIKVKGTSKVSLIWGSGLTHYPCHDKERRGWKMMRTSKASLIWGLGLTHKLFFVCPNYGEAWSVWKNDGVLKSCPLAWPWWLRINFPILG